jgi:hypothetical protein
MHLGLGLSLGNVALMGGTTQETPRTADATTARADTTAIRADRA